MAATPRKTRPRRTANPEPAKAPKCAACDGTGEVAVSVRVGRKRRNVGAQNGICLTCFGTGDA